MSRELELNPYPHALQTTALPTRPARYLLLQILRQRPFLVRALSSNYKVAKVGTALLFCHKILSVMLALA